MGIFDFVKSAGAAIFGGDEPKDNEETYIPLRKHVENHGISTDGLDFKVHGNGVVTITGAVPDQDTREKVVLIIGNVSGVNQVDDQLGIGVPMSGGAVPTLAESSEGSAGGETAPADEWASKTYTVESGDTLSGISKKMYGSANKYMVIFEANKPMLSDPDKIYPGQVLRIPPLGD
ncbi:MAG: peptidoglycan-binding protein LysM [Lysobacteraceae bacterium]